MKRSEQGFTIIEVMLFLGVTAALLVVALSGANSMIKSQRFSDSVDNLHSFIQQQYEEVATGVNPRSGANVPECSTQTTLAGTEESCLLVGKMISFTTNSTTGAQTITSRYVISTAHPNGSVPGVTDLEKLTNSLLTVPDTEGAVSYELRWGAGITKATRNQSASPSGRVDINNIAFIRMPDANRFVTLFFPHQGSGNNPTQSLNKSLETTYALDPPSEEGKPSGILCVKNTLDFGPSARAAAVQFVRGQGSAAITTNYEPGSLCV